MGTRNPGISLMSFNSRPMHGWVRATPQAFADDELRNRLFQASLAFVTALPPKAA